MSITRSSTGSSGSSTGSTSSGSPIPATGLPMGVQVGPLGKRLVAQLIDIALPAVILAVLIFVTRTAVADVIGGVLILAWLLLVLRMGATRAATPGMRAMKLQLVGLQDGRPVGWGRFFLRELVLVALGVSVVGLLAMLALLVRTPRRQGWHDLLADTVLIKQRGVAPAQTRPAPARPPAATQVQAPAQPSPSSPRSSLPAVPPVRPVSTEPERSAVPVASASTPPPAETPNEPGKMWFAVLDDGRALKVDGLVLLGRNPQARPGEEVVDVVKVSDDSRTVSKTHLALIVDDTGIYVMDRGSTNGTTVTNSAGISTMCPAGEVVPVTPDAIVSFGDHWLRIGYREDR